MRATEAKDLLGPAAVVAVGVYLLLRLFYGDLPPLPRYAGTTLFVLAVIEAGYGVRLRSRIRRRPGTEPVDALSAARAVALAKASSLGAAVVAAAWLAVAAYTVPRRGALAAAADDATTALIGLAGALVLIAAALWLEHCCRTPDDPRTDRVGDTRR